MIVELEKPPGKIYKTGKYSHAHQNSPLVAFGYLAMAMVLSQAPYRIYCP
jgi:hypothetical protein